MAKQLKIDPALAAAMAGIEKDYGSGSIFFLGDSTAMDTERIPTGVFSLDDALGGGIGKGSIVELYGPPGGGKSSLSMRIAAQAQRLNVAAGGDGRNVAFIDMEHGMNKELAVSCGLDIGRLIFDQPKYGEWALEITDRLVRVPSIDVIIVDSVAAMTPRAEMEGDYGDSHVALQARMMSQGMRKLNATMNDTKSNCVVIFINQIREKIGGMPSFGPSTTTSGGRGLTFAASVRCEVTRVGPVKRGTTDVIGHEVRVKVPKNRFYRPYTEANFDILYEDGGISDESSIIKIGKAAGVIHADKQGWHTNTTNGEKFAHGYLKAIEWLRENPEDMELLKKRITEKLHPVEVEDATA